MMRTQAMRRGVITNNVMCVTAVSPCIMKESWTSLEQSSSIREVPYGHFIKRTLRDGLGRCAGRTVITPRTHSAPAQDYHTYTLMKCCTSMAISYTLELTSLRTDGCHMAHIREHLHHDFVGFFNVPVGIQEMMQPPLPSPTRNIPPPPN